MLELLSLVDCYSLYMLIQDFLVAAAGYVDLLYGEILYTELWMNSSVT